MEYPKPSLQNQLIARLVNIGRAEQKLIDYLEDPMFDNLSKHDTYWHSEHEVECNKLEDSRCKLKGVHGFLWDVVALLNKQTEDE